MKHQHLFERTKTLIGGEGPDEAAYGITCYCGVKGWEYCDGGYSWRIKGVEHWMTGTEAAKMRLKPLPKEHGHGCGCPHCMGVVHAIVAMPKVGTVRNYIEARARFIAIRDASSSVAGSPFIIANQAMLEAAMKLADEVCQ